MYEGDRVIGAETLREAEWSTEDREVVLAQYLWEQELNDHGIPLEDAISLEADPDNGEGSYMFRAGVPVEHPETHEVSYAPVVDYAKKAALDAEDAYKEANPGANMNGRFFPVMKVSRGD